MKFCSSFFNKNKSKKLSSFPFKTMADDWASAVNEQESNALTQNVRKVYCLHVGR